jgi:hypothetical protein
VRSALFTLMSPLYSMNPRSRNLFHEEINAGDVVVPTISASVFLRHSSGSGSG